MGRRIEGWLEGKEKWPELDAAVEMSARDNVFFTPWMQHRALGALAEGMLREEVLRNWLEQYPEPGPAASGKVCGVVAAGNIPAVAFHDILTVLAAGWRPLVKLSSKDRYLLPVLFPGVEFCGSTDGWTPDAMLTMGGDAAAAYFETHFPDIPKIIRSSRFSMAVLTGSEDSSALEALAEDILLYYGLGCRSATCLLVPQRYNLSGAMAAAEAFALRHWERPGRDNHRKNRAVLTLSGEEFLDSGTVIFRDLRRMIPGASEDISLCRPLDMNLHVGEVWYVEYRSEMELEKFIGANEDRIQKIIRNFGYAQRPELDDWPDGVDTVGFLRGVNK